MPSEKVANAEYDEKDKEYIFEKIDESEKGVKMQTLTSFAGFSTTQIRVILYDLIDDRKVYLTPEFRYITEE